MAKTRKPTARSTPVAAAPQRRFRRRALVLFALLFVAGAGLWWWFQARGPVRLNLVLLTIDTLRADHVGAYGARGAETPTLDRLASQGVRFEQVQTAVPLTGPAHATILTGQYPPTHGVRGNVVFDLGARTPTLASMLKAHGYRTAAFVGAYPVAAAFGFGQGFDTFDEEFHESIGGEPGGERRANEVADAAIKWLQASPAGLQAPFFTWLHFYDPHAPYDPPSPYREKFAGRPYDGEIAFTDAQIGRVLEALRASGRDRDTVIVALADHGEGLGDHQELTHAVLIYQSTMHVPLIVAGPGVPSGRSVPARVATIDVLPTVLGLLGLPSDKSLFGRDLRPLMTGQASPGDPYYAESLYGRLNCHWATLRGWVKDDWKLILGAEPELYNLSDDPGELKNLASVEGDRVKRMSDELQRAVQRLAPGGVDKTRAAPVTAEQEERLRSLGYVAGSGGSGALDDPRLPNPRTHIELYDRLQAATVASGSDLPKAFDTVAAITRLDPGNPFAFGTLASMAYRFGNLADAAHAFARTLELDPDRPGVRQNYGKLLRELGRDSDSERELRIALEQTTEDDSRTRINLVETLVATGKTAEAEKLLAAVLVKEPKNPEALGAKARLLAVEGRITEALPLFEAAAATPDPEPVIELAQAYLAAGDVAKARSAAEGAVRMRPGHPWAMAVLGTALVRDGQRAVGIEYLNRAMGAGPRRPAVWESVARGFDAAGQAALAANCRRNAAAITAASRG